MARCVRCKLHQEDESGQRNSRCAQPFLIPTHSLTASSPPWQLSVHLGASKAALPCAHCQGHSPSPLERVVKAEECGWSRGVWMVLAMHGVHSSASAGQESSAAELPSRTSDFHAPSCLQLGRNCFGAALNAGILTAGPWQCKGEGHALLIRVIHVLWCRWVWG